MEGCVNTECDYWIKFQGEQQEQVFKDLEAQFMVSFKKKIRKGEALYIGTNSISLKSILEDSVNFARHSKNRRDNVDRRKAINSYTEKDRRSGFDRRKNTGRICHG